MASITNRIATAAQAQRAVALVAAVACLAPACPLPGADKIKRSVPLSAAEWTVDLRQYGYRIDKGFVAEMHTWSFHTDALFLGDNALLATFVTREPVEGLQKRDNPRQQFPFRLHAIVLDAASGKFLRQFARGSDYQDVGIVLRDEGSFAVFLGDRIDFYSADFAPRGEAELAESPGAEDVRSFSSSPSGRTMLVQYGKYSKDECAWVSGEGQLEKREACPPVAIAPRAKRPIGAAVSDEDVASVTGHSWESASVIIQRNGEPPRKLCSCNSCYLPQFVDERTLLVFQPGSARLVRDDGKVVWRKGNESVFRVHIYDYVPESHLLVVPFGSGEDVDYFTGLGVGYTGAAVYDVSVNKEVFRLNVYTQGGWLQGLTVSPDGTRLVLQASGIVRSFSLPPH